MFTSENKHAPITINNKDLVLVCLAQLSPKNLNQTTYENNISTINEKVLKNYTKISNKIIIEQTKIVMIEFSKLLYYISCNYIFRFFFKDFRSLRSKLKKHLKFKLH